MDKICVCQHSFSVHRGLPRTYPGKCEVCECARMQERARRFYLFRTEDASGVSGTGVVAEGTLFASGKVAIAFCSGPALEGHPSIIAYDSMKAVEEVHGHQGLTKVVWVDE